MSGVNKVILVGRLGAEPEVRNTPGGAMVCTLSMATSESWVKDGKREEKTEWHRVVLWGKLAELAQKYLKKGRQVYIEGRLQTRSWQDPQGQKRYATEVIGSVMQFIDSGAGQREGYEGASAEEAPPHHGNDSYYSAPANGNMYDNSRSNTGRAAPALDDDIPF